MSPALERTPVGLRQWWKCFICGKRICCKHREPEVVLLMASRAEFTRVINRYRKESR